MVLQFKSLNLNLVKTSSSSCNFRHLSSASSDLPSDSKYTKLPVVEKHIKLHEVDPSFETLYSIKKDRTSNKFYYQNLANALANNSDEPRLEELFEPPPFNSTTIMSLSRQKLATLKDFEVPVGEDQIEHVLSTEFKDKVFKTNWNNFSSLIPSEAEAAKLISQKFIWEQLQKSKKPSTSNIPYAEFPKTSIASELIQDECEIVEKELQTGDYSRHQPVIDDKITKGRSYTQVSASILESAAKTLGRNPSMHPVMKTKTLSIIADILSN